MLPKNRISMEPFNPEEYKTDIQIRFSRYSKEELVNLYNEQVDIADSGTMPLAYISALKDALLNTGLDCSRIIKGNNIQFADKVKIDGNKLARIQLETTTPLSEEGNKASSSQYHETERKEKKQTMILSKFTGTILKVVVVVALIVAASTKQPYSYYMFIRWLVMASSLFFAYKAYASKQEGIIFVYVGMAILFNPFQKFWFHKDTWHVIDYGVAFFVASTIFIERIKNLNKFGSSPMD